MTERSSGSSLFVPRQRLLLSMKRVGGDYPRATITIRR